MIERLRALFGEVSFHRGLALGALVGSAIAGSTIWARIRESRAAAESDERDNGPDTPTSAPQIDAPRQATGRD
jgi:hypothetical protein